MITRNATDLITTKAIYRFGMHSSHDDCIKQMFLTNGLSLKAGLNDHTPEHEILLVLLDALSLGRLVLCATGD